MKVARWDSLEWRLPAAALSIVVVVVVVLGVVNSRKVLQLAEADHMVRLEELATQFSQALSASLAASHQRLVAIAADDGIERLLTDPTARGEKRITGILANLRGPLEEDATLGIWDMDGHPVLTVEPAGASSWPAPLTPTRTGPDGLRAVNDSTVIYEVVAPVEVSDRRMGWIVQQRRLRLQLTGGTVQGVIGSGGALLVGEREGGFWTDGLGPTEAPSVMPRAEQTKIEYTRRGREALAAVRAIPGSPWLMLLERPREDITATAGTYLSWFIPLALALLGIVAAAIWAMARRITQPLAALTDAAAGVASGDLSQRVAISGSHEIAQLGEAFNQMTERIQAQLDEVRRQAELIRQRDDQLRQASKMEAIGRLAGGVAHDFNNVLAVISGTAELMAEDRGPADPAVGDLGEILKASRRAEGLTRQLLAFSRQQVLEPRVLDVDQLIGGMERMLKRLIGEAVFLESRLESDHARVRADPGQLEQVIMNLVINAKDAIGAPGGTVTIESGRVVLDERAIEDHADATTGPHALIAVSDTGSGMSPEVQARIFEPFFTTKGLGKGTGLGLATVYGIVKQSGGHIWVYSEPGRGTTFKVFLPLAEGEESPPEAPAVEATASLAHERILLVEDDAAVRRVAASMLERRGYRVVALEGAKGAIAVALAARERIDLLITDVVMPDMSGPDLARTLQEISPDLRVLYVSGYTDSTIARHGLTNDEAFVQKPFSGDALARKVREILDRTPPTRAVP